MFSKDKYKPNLFNQDSDSDDGAPAATFGTNKEFAKNFNKLRSKELLKKHKNVSDSDSSSDDSDDSSDNDTINPKFDEAFYRALASIKKKDPAIYTDKTKFFDDFDAAAPPSTSTAASGKAMTIVDYERKILLEKGGRYDEDDEDEQAEGDDDDGGAARPQSPSYNQEQQNLRAAFKKVIDADSDEDEGGDAAAAEGKERDAANAEWGGIFKRRDKSKAEEAAEEEQYTKWLAGEAAANIDGQQAETLKPLKEYWSNPKLAKEEAFLRDYILNNGYTKRSDGQIPCYDDIVGNNVADAEAGADRSDDEAELEKQAEFEHKFNFRFEEPDADFIKRYPRTIENSVRRTDDRRKEKRQEVKDRKEREKAERMRELEMLSTMRKREIEDKIAKLKLVTGDEAAHAFDDADLDGDFDPEEHDRKMQAVFNSEYYGVDEGEEKPECPAGLEDLEVEDWDNYDPTQENGGGEDDDDAEEGGHCEDGDFDMDCEPDAEAQKRAFQSEMVESSRRGNGKRKRKRKSKFMEVLQAKKPVFDPNDEKSFGEYLDEYYAMDYEDVIGDTPCRFRYVETVPNDFGLTVEEILMAKNKELNQWASLKKATQIRPEHVERNEVGLFKQKGKNEALKRKILQSLYEVPSDEELEEPKPKVNEKSSKMTTIKKPQTFSVKAEDNFSTIDEKPIMGESDTKPTVKKVAQPKKETAAVKSETKTTEKVEKTIKSEKPDTTASTSDSSVKPTVTTPKPNQKRRKPDSDAATPKPQTTPTVAKKPKLTPTVAAKSNPKNSKPVTKNVAIKPLQNGAKKHQPKNAAKTHPKKPASNSKASTTKSTAASAADPKSAISDERLRAFGINPKKFHKKQKYGTDTPKKDGAAVKKPTNGQTTPNGKAPGKQSQQQQKNGKAKSTANNNRQRAAGRVGGSKQPKGANLEALKRMKAKMFANS